MGPYSAAKAALGALTTALRVELADTPIRVVDVRPGDIDTAFHEQTKRSEGSGGENVRRQETVWRTQQRNMAAAPTPDHVAQVVLRSVTIPNPPPVLVAGGFFQARVAPLAARLSPPRLQEYVLRRYYHL